MKKISSVKLSSYSQSVTSSLNSFNLYDGNTFTTFFYSNIEKIWFITVKSGLVKINDESFSGSMILYSPSYIEYNSATIKFTNLRDEIVLSQILVEKFLRSKESKILQTQIFDLIKNFSDKQLIFECLERNSLFSHSGGEWFLNYQNYIDFLELKIDPLISSVLYELENGYYSGGLTKTFSVSSIWSNPQFSEEESYSNFEKTQLDAVMYNKFQIGRILLNHMLLVIILEVVAAIAMIQ